MNLLTRVIHLVVDEFNQKLFYIIQIIDLIENSVTIDMFVFYQ